MGQTIKKQISASPSDRIADHSGFTLLEITVCIFIIVMGLMGILSLANQNIQVETINKNTLIASQLAQEGLETVRNKRDINWLQEGDWEKSSSSVPDSRLDILQEPYYNYTIDASTGAMVPISGGIADPRTQLYLNSSGFYTHNSANASPTGFYRLISVGNESAASTSVTCLVQWKKGSNTYNFSAQTVLYNWK
ncbi:MAG TPA: hypothetical protein VMC41_01990 [Candidatus Nanoarchaeia archaeon]|nr:hypothetical protein [Candidatus Nanoarchaeia archaeon]